ncbi:MAG TPA: methyltransferase domain-containing protein [Edaphocola sp.]|nr:methyltransferase domain-containing protein [Edaphocola sp.]
MKFIISAVEEVIQQYKGGQPLNLFLKSFFKTRPKLGSRDRRVITDSVYTYYRIAKFTKNPNTRIWDILNWALKEQVIEQPILEKIIEPLNTQTINVDFNIFDDTIFSEGIINQEWTKSILKQSKTFIRIREGFEQFVKETLTKNNILYYKIKEHIVALENGVKLQNILAPETYVIQDFSSQRSLDALKPILNKQSQFSIWDACSGAGGKTILIKDSYPKTHLFCTDLRSNILFNLKERAKLYQLKNIKTQVLDITKAEKISEIKQNFDIIISDVPCSGSGTWARTPEQFYYFDPIATKKFNQLQTTIIRNASTKVKPGGHLAYITCSVFKEENENVIAHFLKDNSNFKLLSQNLINGIEDQADSMFTALLQKQF